MPTLITNLSYVSINGVRTHTNALVIDTQQPIFGNDKPCVKVRGFASSASDETFDLSLATGNPSYELIPAQGGPLFIGENEDGSSKEPKPLFQGGVLRLAGGTELSLMKATFDQRPIDVIDNVPGAEDGYETLWPLLAVKVAEYTDTPAGPLSVYLKSDDLRWVREGGEERYRQLVQLVHMDIGELRGLTEGTLVNNPAKQVVNQRLAYADRLARATGNA